MSRAGRIRSVVLAAIVVMAACAGDDGTTGTTPAPTAATTTSSRPTSPPITGAPAASTTATATSVAPASTRPPEHPDERGPFPVGLTTLRLGDRDADVFYPAAESARGEPTEDFAVVDALPEPARAIVPEALRGTIDTHAVRDAPPAAAGPFPVIVYSHGFGGFRQVADSLLSHLASWGFVVATVDHVERGLATLVSAMTTPSGRPAVAADQDVTDVRNVLHAVQSSTGPLQGLADAERTGIVGHSAGAGTAVRAAWSVGGIDGIDAFVSISGGPGVSVRGGTTGISFATVDGLEPGDYALSVEAITDDGAIVKFLDEPGQLLALDDLVVTAGPATITLATAPGATLGAGVAIVSYHVPEVPGLVIYAERDQAVPPRSSKALFDSLEAQGVLVGIAGAGHNSFTDTCPEILDRGGIEQLRALIGGLVDLAQDGCTPGSADPRAVRRLVEQYVTAFFQLQLTDDGDPAELTEAAADRLGGVSLVEFVTA
jgi:predicted dienelactone hydrolase